jgi:hypothetical protein
MKIKFEVTASLMGRELVRTFGIERDGAHLTIAQLTEVVEIEQKLEHLTGLRWHITPHEYSK